MLQQTKGQFTIRIAKRDKIDSIRWNHCISQSCNESPLGYTWIMDYLAPHWQGAIIGDYAGVIPLPIINRLGIKTIQMPLEVITLGPFSPNPGIIELFPDLLNLEIFSPFKYINYNGSPDPSKLLNGNNYIIKQTFELDLKNQYQEIKNGYSRSHIRNIKNFYASGLTINIYPNPEIFTSLIAEIGAERKELFMPRGYRKQFEEMTKYALANNLGETYSVWKNSKLIGGAFFLIGSKRIIPYHLANEQGRFHKTSFAIIDKFIQEHCGQEKVLDFAGSVIPNVATFNKRFGAKPVNYCAVTINHFPQPLRWIKENNLLFRFKQFFFK